MTLLVVIIQKDDNFVIRKRNRINKKFQIFLNMYCNRITLFINE